MAGVPADPFAPRQRRSTSTFADRWDKSTSKAILQDILDAVTLAGRVNRGEIDQYAFDPQTGEVHTNPELVDDAGSLAGMLTLGAGAIPRRGLELRAGMSLPRDIRPPKENLNTVIDSNFTNGSVVGDETVDIDSLIGGTTGSPSEATRVKRLASQIADPETGYFERIIADDAGNVVEGQHRLDALRELGVRDVPILRVRDNARNVDTAAMTAAIKGAGSLSSDNVNQIVGQVADMLGEVGGDPNLVRQEFEFPRGFEKYFEAALGTIARQPRGIRAYHGSPHSFDKFSSERIGTGEGAQAYGHGLYAAENEAVARGYRDALAKPLAVAPDSDVSRLFEKYVTGHAATHPEKAFRVGGNLYTKPEGLVADFKAGIIDRTTIPDDLRAALEAAPTGGHMYEVDIAANPEDFLDWDKPLSEQPESVRQSLEQLGIVPGSRGVPSEWLQESTGIKEWVETGASAYEKLRGGEPQAMSFGVPVPRNTADSGGKAATQLRQAGIPGIRYLDQGSRGTHTVIRKNGEWGILKPNGNEGLTSFGTKEAAEAEAKRLDDKLRTSNYVVFDDSLISILKKYGVVGPVLAALGLSQALPDQAEASEQQGGGW